MARWLNQLRGNLIEGMLAHAPRATRLASRALLGRRVVFFAGVQDPYTYLLAQVLPPLVEAAGVELEVCVVGEPMRAHDPAPEARRAYGPRDAALLARYLEVDFEYHGGPLAPELVAQAQAIAALPRPAAEQLEVLRVVGEALWRSDGAALSEAESELGVAVECEVAAILSAGGERLRRTGHYLPGTLFYDGQWYWGLDRLSHLARALDVGEGWVRRRASPVGFAGTSQQPQTVELGRPTLEFWYSFRSPYSYLALERTFAMADRCGVDLKVRPVLPMVMRGLSVPLVKRLYIVSDCAREARRLGIPFGKIKDPLGPGIASLLAIWPLAESAGRGREFLLGAARGVWSRAMDVSDEADLRSIVEGSGLEWAAAQDALDDVRGGTNQWEVRASQERKALVEAGLWGVPSFRIGGHALWGQDRLWIVEELLQMAVRESLG